MDYINIATTLLVTIIVLLAAQLRLKSGTTRVIDDAYMVPGFKVLFLILIIAAVLVRAYGLGSIPGVVNQDNAVGALNAKALGTYGIDLDGVWLPMHFNAWGHSQMSALPSYLAIPFVKLFGLNIFATALPALIISVLAMAAGGILVKAMFDEKTALFFMTICISNPWHFSQSRWFMDANFFPHFFMLGAVLVFLAYSKKKSYLYYLAMIFFAMSHYCYGVSVFIVPLFLVIIYVYMYAHREMKVKDFIVSVLVYTVLSLPFYLMLAINTFGLKTISLPFMTIPFFAQTRRANDILLFSDEPITQMVINIKAFFSVILGFNSETIWTIVPKFGSMMLFTIPMVVLGIGYICHKLVKGKETRFEKKLACVMLLVWLLVSVIDGIMIREVNSNRLNIIFYCLMIFMALGVRFVAANSKKLLIVVTALWIGMTGLFVVDYYTVYAARFYNPEYSFSGNFQLALNKAKDMDADYYVITPDTQYIGAVDVTQFDTLFIFDVDVKYYLGQTDEYNGEAGIPYSERFQYRKVSEDDVNDYTRSVVYIVNGGEESLFDNDNWTVYEYPQFVTVVPKRMTEGK